MSGTPVVTTDTSGNNIETYPDFVDASGFTVSKVVTTYTEIPYSTIALSGISIGMAIVWMIVNSFLICIGYILFGFGGKTGYGILGLCILCVLIMNIYTLSTLNRVPKCTDITRKKDNNTSFSMCSGSDDRNSLGIYSSYQWNVGQLIASLIFLGFIVPKITGSKRNNSGNISSNTNSNQTQAGGKRKGSNRRRT